jgi:serine/threonine protein kinase/WD40 repeat protein
MNPGSSYTPGREIARGGMGAILSATDQSLDREVAMKVMLVGAEQDQVARQRFVREALVLARLEHPNIVPIHEMGRNAEGQLFYTMKLVKGRTLQAILTAIKKGDAATTQHYTLDRLLAIYRKVCDAVAFAHHHRIIHRDLKPENVMVGEFGEVLVMDWGLAKHLDDELHAKTEATQASAIEGFQELSDAQLAAGESGLTLEGAVMGSPQYMPPEQAEGRLADIGTHSDIYSLGGILYAILTLRHPVEGRKVSDVLSKVISGEITPPTHYNASRSAGPKLTGGEVADASKVVGLPHCPAGKVPASLSAVTMRAMALQPADRYADVAQIIADVEAYQGGFATSAEKANALTLVRLFIHRHKALTAAASLMVVLTMGFVAKVISSEQHAKAEAVKAREAEAVAEQKEAEARKALAKSALSLAEAAMREADGPAMQTALNDVPADLRDPTWGYLLAQSDSSIARIRIGTASAEGAAADPSRPGVFAIADQGHKITIQNVRTGERLLEFQPGFSQPDKANQYRLAFSPDGQRLAVGRNGPGGLVIHRARDGAKLSEWATPASDQVEFGSDEKLLRHGGKTLQVWNSHTGTLLWEDKVMDILGVMGNFIPGGTEVLKATIQNRLQVVRASDGSLVRNLGGRAPFYRWRMVVHPDGRSAFTYTVGGITECVSLTDGKTLFTLPQKQSRDWIGVTADGEQLVTTAVKIDGVQLIEVWEARTGNAIRSLLGGQGTVATLSVHPRSNELLISGANTRVWDLTGQLPAWRLPSFHMGRPVFWDSDDLILSTSSNPWGLLRLTPGGTQPVWQPANRNHHTAAVSANGRLAVSARPGFSTDAQWLRRAGDSVEQFGQVRAAFWPYRLRPSPNGESVALMERAATNLLQVFAVATGKIAFRPELNAVTRINDLGWLGKDRMVGLVTVNGDRGNPGAEERILLWDAATGKVLQSVTHATAMDALAVAPDGRQFAEAGADKLIRIRDAATLAVRSAFRAHDAPITVLAWHPTQPQIASGSDDLSIKVLDFEKVRRVSEFRGLLNPPDHLAFSGTGKRLVAKTATDNQIRIWRLADESARPQQTPGTKSGEWEDLLAPLTPAVVERTGNGWRMDNGVLFSPAAGFATLPLPGSLSGTSYQVRVKLRRLSEKLLFHLQLPVADRLVGFQLDAFPNLGNYTGLNLVQGKGVTNAPGSARGKQVKDSEQHDLELTVRLDGSNATVTATLDSQPLYQWAGPTSDLSPDPRWATPPGSLALGTHAIDWVVYEVKVKRLDARP